MKIHSPNAHRKASLLKSDYFYNYFTFGMVRNSCKDCSVKFFNDMFSGLAVWRQTQPSQEIHSAYKFPWSLQLQHVSSILIIMFFVDWTSWFVFLLGLNNKESCFLWIIASKQHTCIVSIYNSLFLFGSGITDASSPWHCLKSRPRAPRPSPREAPRTLFTWHRTPSGRPWPTCSIQRRGQSSSTEHPPPTQQTPLARHSATVIKISYLRSVQ